jgi:glycine oxidase
VGFRRGVEPRDLASIRSELGALFPKLRDQPTACAWSGFRPCCEDMKPVIGKVPGQEHVYVAAGHFRKGILLAPATGKILADLITRGETDLPIKPLSPARFGV